MRQFPWATPTTKSPDAVKRSLASRRSQAIGEHGQAAAAFRLGTIGLQMIERIETASTQRGGKRVFLRKVSGDIRAVWPPGRSVLCEVKVREDQLQWSDLQPHQREALDKHHELGGISLVAWVRGLRVYVLHWPLWHQTGARHTPILPQVAESMDWKPENPKKKVDL